MGSTAPGSSVGEAVITRRLGSKGLTLSLRPSDMKRGQSMVKYTFLFIKFILPEFVSYLGEIGVLCVRNS